MECSACQVCDCCCRPFSNPHGTVSDSLHPPASIYEGRKSFIAFVIKWFTEKYIHVLYALREIQKVSHSRELSRTRDLVFPLIIHLIMIKHIWTTKLRVGTRGPFQETFQNTRNISQKGRQRHHVNPYIIVVVFWLFKVGLFPRVW